MYVVFFGMLCFNLDLLYLFLMMMFEVMCVCDLVQCDLVVLVLFDVMECEVVFNCIGGCGILVWLVDVLVVSIIWGWVECVCSDVSGWIVVVCCLLVGWVLVVVYQYFECDWLVNELVVLMGVLCFSFIEKFLVMVGEILVKYVVCVKMFQVCYWIVCDGLWVVVVVNWLGYDLEVLFSCVFKCIIGYLFSVVWLV